MTWSALQQRNPEWISDKKIAVLYQMGVAKSAQIPADVPLILDFATSLVAEGKVLVASRGGKDRDGLGAGPRSSGAAGELTSRGRAPASPAAASP